MAIREKKKEKKNGQILVAVPAKASLTWDSD
jgi:hypothetical protein